MGKDYPRKQGTGNYNIYLKAHTRIPLTGSTETQGYFLLPQGPGVVSPLQARIPAQLVLKGGRSGLKTSVGQMEGQEGQAMRI